MTVAPTDLPTKFACPVCDQPVPVGAERCPNPNCKADLSAVAAIDSMGVALYQAALQQIRAGKTEKALESLEAALAYDPRLVDARVVKGKLLAKMGQYEAAIHTWNQVLELCPGETRALAGIEQAWQRVEAAKPKPVKSRGWLLFGGISLAALVIGIAGGWLLFYRPAAVPPAPPSFAQVVAKDARLSKLALKVQEQAGSIQVSGVVPDETYRQWILSLAQNALPGKKVDVDGLVVPPPPDLASKVKLKLSQPDNQTLQGLPVDVQQQGSGIVLSGEVPSQEILSQLQAAVGSVEGVTAVDVRKVKVSPVDLVTAVQAKIQQEALLANATIHVEQQGYGVKLAGRLPSWLAKAAAERAAGGAPGVAWVDSRDLQVNEQGLADSIQAALKADPRTSTSALTVEQVESGVRLSGTVTRPELPEIVAEVVRAVPGVSMVDTSGLKVEWQGRTYTVKQGDNLTGIAQRMYGQWWMWSVIYAANRDKITDPRGYFLPGQVLLIPDMIPGLDQGPYR